ncbi:MAG: lipoate--protein ligase family protein [Thermoanaerobaculales bacterium]|jgi:lipoate-protein ligase A|nr:lipoate--protein ligase family protein [Thermoanaerobaculales bacterium]
MQWRLILDGALPGALNMARDMAILEAVAAGLSPPTVRLYGWAPPCLTLGKHQGLEVVDLDFCRARGIEVARRPTGGRALLHHLELTYSLVAPLGRPPIPSRLQDAYRLICSALVDACRSLGVDAELTGGEVNLRLPEPTSPAPCFESPAEGEVVVRGRKLIGSAMRAHAGSVLQHGAILLNWDGRLQAGALGLTDDTALRPRITTLAAELGREVELATIETAVADAVAGRLGVGLAAAPLSPAESSAETGLRPRFAIDHGIDPA